MTDHRGCFDPINYPMNYDGPTQAIANLGRLALSPERFMSGYSGVTHVMQIESVDGVLFLTERVLSEDRRQVLGISRTLASAEDVDHGDLHTFMRAWMLCQPYMLDFGPAHCDTECADHWADDKWYGDEYTYSWRLKLGMLGPSCPA